MLNSFVLYAKIINNKCEHDGSLLDVPSQPAAALFTIVTLNLIRSVSPAHARRHRQIRLVASIAELILCDHLKTTLVLRDLRHSHDYSVTVHRSVGVG